MANAIVWYEGACKSLLDACAKSRNVEELKEIDNAAAGFAAYARAAKNRSMLADAWEIRVNTTRKLGWMLKTGENDRAKVGRPWPVNNGIPETPLPTLNGCGIDKGLARRARKLYRLTAKEFKIFVMDGRAAINDGIDRALKTIEREEKRARSYRVKGRTEMLAELSEITGQFGVFYADPPWTFEVYSGKGKERSAERYYDTMDLEEIKGLPVQRLAAKDCALFLWGVWPNLPGALEVIKAWGFDYKTAAFVWVKQVSDKNEKLFTGMGYWTRANSEPCLLATRGNPPRYAKDVHQVVMSPIGEHSVKPETVRERIQNLVPGPYLELFGRKRVEGWTVWGDEL